jgi:DNA primase
MSAIDEVKQKIDITEVIGQYATLKKAGRNLTALCPFHSEKHPSFFVYPEQQSWHCFGACNTGGDVFAFIMKKEGLDFGEALRQLALKAGVTLPSKMETAGKKEEKEEFYQVNEAAALYFHNLLLNATAAAKAKSYVEKRGFTAKTIADFQLGFSLDSWSAGGGLKLYLGERGYSEETMLTAGLLIKAEDGRTYDRFRGKLMFPIHDIRGRVTGFGARVLDDSLPKYINSPQTPTFDKSSTLYGIDRAAAEIRKQDKAIIMEGYMDVIMAHQNGVTNAIASMGTAITETQVNMLKKLTKNLFLAFDADIAGLEANRRGGEIVVKPADKDTAPRYSVNTKTNSLILNEAEVRKAVIIGTRVINEEVLNIDARVIELPENKDPDDVIREDINNWKSLVNKATPLMDYMFEKTALNLDLTTAKDKSLFVDRLLPIVAEINDPIRQAHYLQKLAAMVKVDMNTIKASLSRLKPPQIKRKTLAQRPSVTRPLRPLASNSREEYCLALLLQYPELKSQPPDPSPEYFESSENREIFNAWQEESDILSLRERIDPAIHEHLDAIIKSVVYKTLSPTDIERRYTACIRELEKRYYQNLEARRGEIFAQEVESGGKGADIVRLQKEGIEPSTKLRELDAHKKRNPSGTGRTRR